jgi:putative transposase
MPEFFNPSGEIFKHGESLPHWQQGEAMQFVTFRLADAMPQTKLRQWREERETWIHHHPKPWDNKSEAEYHRLFTWKIEDWLDQGAGSCIFKKVECRQVLEDALMHDHLSKATHHAWVIMPNHVHLLFTPNAAIEKLMQSWKGVSARKIRQGSIWQKNYRDTLIRDASHFANAVRYIRRNPIKLPPNTYTLWQSQRALEI